MGQIAYFERAILRLQIWTNSVIIIERLEADLATREVELKALESGEQLAELEANICQDLLADK